MKKILAAVVLFSATQALALGDFLITTGGLVNATTILPTASVIASSEASSYNKELMVAAREDAQDYIQNDGLIDQSLVLRAALKEVSRFQDLQGASDLEKAEAVIYLSELQ